MYSTIIMFYFLFLLGWRLQCLRLSTCSIFVCLQGYFMRPAVITDVKDDSRLIQEEIFGPVTCVLPFDTEEEAIRRANNVQYGLCATVWTTNVTTLHRVSRELQVIRDNTPVVYIFIYCESIFICKVLIFVDFIVTETTKI
jgi:hypothetical protein